MPAQLRYALLLGGLILAAGAFTSGSEEANACPRTRDIVLELKFATTGEDGEPKTETVRLVQRAQKGVYGQPCDRKARRRAEQRACIVGLADTFKAIGDPEASGPQRAACKGLGEDVTLPQFDGAYRLEEATLTCDMRLQAPARPQQLSLAIDVQPTNFVCEKGEPREVGTLEERCRTFASLSGKLNQLAAACPRPREGVEGVEVIDQGEAATGAAGAGGAAAGDMMQFCLRAGVAAASARLDEEKARMQACISRPPAVPQEKLAALLPPDGTATAAAGEAGAPGAAVFEDTGEAVEAEAAAGEGQGAGEFAPEPPVVAEENVPTIELGREAAPPGPEAAPATVPPPAEIQPPQAGGVAEVGALAAPADACEARDRQNRFLAGVAGQFDCGPVPGIPQAPNEEARGCDDRFRALKEQYFTRRIDFIEACIARLKL